MPPAQRKDDILQADIPATLPLMALRSTIVYPLGTIAVQMGAPENLALLKANEQSGLIVGLVVASGDHDDVLDPERFVGRVGVAARVHEVLLNGADGLDHPTLFSCAHFYQIDPAKIAGRFGRVAPERRRQIGRKIVAVYRLPL